MLPVRRHDVVGFGLKPGEQAATEEIAKQGKGNTTTPGPRGVSLGDRRSHQEAGEKREAGPAQRGDAHRSAGGGGCRRTAEDAAGEEIVTVSELASFFTVNSYAINRVSSYDAELRQPTTSRSDWWVGAAGIPVEIVRAFENPERKVVEGLRPEDYLGVVPVTSTRRPTTCEWLSPLRRRGRRHVDSYKVQESNGFNQDMVVPVRRYMLWIAPKGGTPTLLEEEVQVSGGQVSACENEREALRPAHPGAAVGGPAQGTTDE